jgi:hypothetical protein
MVTILIMMKWVLISVGALLLVVLLIGGFFIYRFREMILGKMPLMPDELKVAKVVWGANQFSKEIFYSEPDLGVITDIGPGTNHELVVVGQSGAAFLTEDRILSRNIHFEKCNSDVISVELGSGAFLCRGTWNTNTTLLDLSGKTLWSYGGRTPGPGIDDAAVGELGADGTKRVVVGFNGDGGVRLLSSEGKELWKQDDGNVWHVEIAAADARSGNVILHSNARGQLTIRDSTGNVLGRYSPEIYLSHFALTAWGDDPSRNKLVAVDKGFIYVLTMEGKTVARLPAPATASMAQPKGTPVRFAKGTPYFASLLRHFLWNRSLLYFYDGQNQLVYDEILDHDCDALLAVPGDPGAENLLLGCDGTVWKYSPATNR